MVVAHLVEHVMIDAVSFVTGEPIVSGVTAAHRSSKTRFDIFVESPDPAVASLAGQLGLSWVMAALRGVTFTDEGRPTLELARRFYESRPRDLGIDALAHEVASGPADVLETLAKLESAGFLRRSPYTVNFSGMPRYHCCDGSKEARPGGDGHEVTPRAPVPGDGS